MTPEKLVERLSPPVVRVAGPRLMLPEPAIEPTASPFPFRNSKPEFVMKIEDVSGIWLLASNDTTSADAPPTPSPMINWPGMALVPGGLLSSNVPSLTRVAVEYVLFEMPLSVNGPGPVL